MTKQTEDKQCVKLVFITKIKIVEFCNCLLGFEKFITERKGKFRRLCLLFGVLMIYLQN